MLYCEYTISYVASTLKDPIRRFILKFHKKLILSLTVFLACSGLTSFAKTILFVPQDDRPVDLAYTVSTAEKAGYTVLTPPSRYLSGKRYQGQPERVWTWVEQNINRADACVISTDTLIYGGLVDSRKHNEDLSTLEARENRIRSLHAQYPKVPIYAFGTIMRTPFASNSGVEPYYYANYGTKLYRISALQDKMDKNTITNDEAAELLSLKLSIPTEYLQDWYRRRTKNTIINKRLMTDAKNGVFTYYCEGHDDNSKDSQSAMEARYLDKAANKLPSSRYGSFPGADQLGLLLIARYHVDSNHMKPAFSVIYPLGRAEDTVPSYESQPIGKTIAQHIDAVGGTIVTKNKPDIVLAVNTPLFSTGESGQFSNFGMLKQSTLDFVDQIKEIIDGGTPVAMADVYFANGSDNTLMNLLKKNDLLYKLAAYDGWNTASNTIGYAIAQSILAPEMSPVNHKDMLIEQYLDNWGYQANVRKNITRIAGQLGGGDKPNQQCKEEMIAELQEFAKDKLDINPATVTADFSWDRWFEIHAYVSPTPKYPVYKTLAQKQKEQEEAAKKAELLKQQNQQNQPAASKPQAVPDSSAESDSNVQASTIYIYQ